MTKHQAEILFDSWIDKAERQGRDKEEYAKECLSMLSQEFVDWFGHDFKEVENEYSLRSGSCAEVLQA